VFQALSLPYTPALEAKVLGPLKRGDTLDFPDLGFQVILDKELDLVVSHGTSLRD
jgi:hypothetical protein